MRDKKWEHLIAQWDRGVKLGKAAEEEVPSVSLVWI